MNRSLAGAVLLSLSVLLLAEPAPAGSGIGKGSPPAANESMPAPEPGAATQQGGSAEPRDMFDSTTVASAEQAASGFIGTIHTDSMRFTCQCGAGEQIFATTTVTVFRKSGAPAAFSDLVHGASVTLQYHSEGGSAVADTVDISP